MPRRGPPVSGDAEGPSWSLDGRDMGPAPSGATVADAILRTDELVLTRSAKYRRPRGAFCLVGDCGSCMVRVDGRPNLRACVTPIQAGMRVERQNLHGSATADPTSVVDTVFSRGFDHHKFMVHPRPLNELMQYMARYLTGLGTCPDEGVEVQASVVDRAPDVLIVGHGRAGRTLAEGLRASGVDVLSVDRAPAPPPVSSPTASPTPTPTPISASGPDAAPEPLRTAAVIHDAGMFAAYSGEGVVAGMCVESMPTADGAHRRRETLVRVRPRHLVFATGCRQPTLPVPNNDLPGVVSAQGLLASLRRARGTVARDAVVIGPAPTANAVARALGLPRTVMEDEVLRLEGGARVDSVVTASERIPTSLVVLAPAPAPAHELAVQAGADVTWVDELQRPHQGTPRRGFAVVTDPSGNAAATFGPQRARVWCVGSVAETADIDRCAGAITSALAGGSPT